MSKFLSTGKPSVSWGNIDRILTGDAANDSMERWPPFAASPVKIPAKKSQNIFFPYILGLAFGFGWTPCIGPILGSILALASIEETLSRAILLLSFYSVGLTIPFILLGYLI